MDFMAGSVPAGAERHGNCGVAAAMASPTLTDVPARLDRLPWSGFHRLVVAALGITWILDGLEVTLAGSVAAALQHSPSLRLTPEQVGLFDDGKQHLTVPVRLKGVRIERSRRFGDVYLALALWRGTGLSDPLRRVAD